MIEFGGIPKGEACLKNVIQKFLKKGVSRICKSLKAWPKNFFGVMPADPVHYYSPEYA